MPDLSKILLLNMDCLFFPVLFSNSMPKILYPKPTTNLSQISQIVDGGWCDVEWNYEALIPCFACTVSTSCLSGFNEYIQKARFNH